jgi:ParB family chromosome partitioning protein
MTTTEIELHRLDLAYADLRVDDRRRIARLAADLGGDGQRQPVLVIERNDRFVLIDGYYRVWALQRIGRDTVLAMTLAMPERDALLFVFRTSTGRRRFALEDGWLLRELIEQHAMKQLQLAVLIGRSESFVSRRLALVVHLPESIQKAVRDGKIGPHAAEKSLVPLARANRDHAERLVANLDAFRPTTRQISALYTAWRSADRETRERIVSLPVLFLKAETVEDIAQKDDPVADLVRAIEVISGSCHGARKRLHAAELHRIEGAARGAVTRAFREADLAFGSVRSLLVEEHIDA